jgi:hypothetical protein
MIQERRQQQLAREEAAKLKERVKTALAKAIGWATAAFSRPDLDQADPLHVPTTGGSPGGGSTAPISTKPGPWAEPSRAADADDNPRDQVSQTPPTCPGGSPRNPNCPSPLLEDANYQTRRPSCLPTAKPRPSTTRRWRSTMRLSKPIKVGHVASNEATMASTAVTTGRVETALAKAIAASSRPDLDQANPLPVPTTGGSPGGGSPAPVSSKPGSAAAQHQSGEGNLAASTSKCRKSIQKSTKNFQKRSKFSRQKIGKFRQISMSKNAIRIVLGRSRKKFSHKNKISNKILKKRKEKSHHLSRMESAYH